MASRACGANRNAGRSGPRPPSRYGLARAVAAAPVPLPGAGFVGPHPKTATVERRERSRSPRDRVVARRRRDRKKECACRRSIHPSSGGTVRTRYQRNDQPARKLAARERERRGQRRDSCGRGSRNAVVRSLVASGCLTSLIRCEEPNGNIRLAIRYSPLPPVVVHPLARANARRSARSTITPPA